MPFLMHVYKAGSTPGKEHRGQRLCPMGSGLRLENFSPYQSYLGAVDEVSFLGA